MSIKRGNLLKIILGCVLFLSIALFGINLGYKPASAETDISVTNVMYSAKSEEMYVFHIKLSTKPSSSDWQWYNDQNGDSSVPDQVILNDKSVREWNAEYRETASAWTFNKWPMNEPGFYEKMPIALRSSNGNSAIEIYIHENMYSIVQGDNDFVKLQVCSGLIVNNGMVISNGVSYKITGSNGSFSISEMPDTVEISPDNVSVSGWTEINGIKALDITFGSGVLPSGIDYGVIDKAAYQYIADYIAINGKTVKEINAETSVDGWEFNMFPSDSIDAFKVPVVLYVTANKIEVRIHDNYYATLTDDLTVSVLEGFSVVNGNKEYVLNETVNHTRKGGTWVKNWQTVEIAAEDVDFSGWTSINGIKAFNITLGSGVLPSGINYGVINDASYQYIADYIKINGKTVNDINAETSVDGWEFNMFPSNSIDAFKVPVVVYITSEKIELRVHDNYYATLNGTLTASLLQGLYFVNGNAEYVLAEDATSVCKSGVWNKDWQTVEIQAEDVLVRGWVSINGIKAFYIDFAEGVLPSGINYGVISDAAYKYIANYITINGKTINEINAETSVDGWEFNMFPSRDEDNMPQYQVPILVYITSEKIELRMHDNYYAILPYVQVSVLEGLTIVNGTNEYELSGTANYRRKADQWFDLNYEYSIVYYVNGEVFATDKYKLDETVVMHAAPTVDQGYEFSGWDKTISKVNGDEEITGTITAISYSITYKLGGGKNSPQNPLKYTIEDDTIVLKDATKDGCSFLGWYDADGNKVEQIEAGSYGDIVLNAKFTEESGGGCSSNVSGSIFGYVALLLCAAMVLTLKRVGKKADK